MSMVAFIRTEPGETAIEAWLACGARVQVEAKQLVAPVQEIIAKLLP